MRFVAASFVALLPLLDLAGFGWLAKGAEPTIPPAQIPEGFHPLFDSTSLNGWHVAPRVGVTSSPGDTTKPNAGPISEIQQNAKGRWEVHEGTITGGQDEERPKKPSGEEWGLGSWLMTDATYGDFELIVDARPDWPCDTGIYVRSTPLGQGFQILLDHRGDDDAGIGGSIGFLYLRGIGNFRVSPYNFRWTVGADSQPKEVQLVPATDGVTKMDFAATSEDFRRAWRMNAWNRFRIRVVGELPRITVWINDVKISECDTAAIQHPNYDPAAVKQLLSPRGHIAFEVHDGPSWRWGVGKISRWRNIYLKEL